MLTTTDAAPRKNSVSMETEFNRENISSYGGAHKYSRVRNKHSPTIINF